MIHLVREDLFESNDSIKNYINQKDFKKNYGIFNWFNLIIFVY